MNKKGDRGEVGGWEGVGRIRGWRLFPIFQLKGGYYSRAQLIEGRLLFEDLRYFKVSNNEDLRTL